jgi:uncharacterized protein YjiS (DUF1127 family)
MTAPQAEGMFHMIPAILEGGRIALPRISLHATTSKLAHILARCAARLKQRRTLSMLSDHALRDIGLTRSDVDREIHRALWCL